MVEIVRKQKRWWTKEADTSGTELMPTQVPTDKRKRPEKAVVKAAMAPHIPSERAISAEAVDRAPTHWALPSIQRYPLDSYEEVKTASAYFEQWWSRMAPAHRREYCQNLSKRAAALSIPVSSKVAQYGAEGYSEVVDAHVESRRPLLKEASQEALLDGLLAMRPLTPSDVFCHALAELDKEAGLERSWDVRIVDPYLSVFGTKTAESPDDLVMVGNEAVPRRAIIHGATTHRLGIASMFGEEVADEMMKDPMGIFGSLPRDQKQMIMRMVSNNRPSPDATGVDQR